MKLGTMVHMRGADLEDKIRQVHENGFETCQICCWNGAWLTDEAADRIRALCETYHVEISTFWCGWSGPGVWDFAEGPLTLGLVPPEYRFARMEELKRGSDFAKRLGTENIATHVGFLPEVSGSGEYRSVVAALKHVAHYVKANGQYFLFETGQETPVTLLRTIEDIGTDNLGINLDPANLILYGKANPVDALMSSESMSATCTRKMDCTPPTASISGVRRRSARARWISRASLQNCVRSGMTDRSPSSARSRVSSS